MTDAPAQPVMVRAARESELPAILELTCAAFGEQARDRMRAMLWGDSSLKLDDLRLAVVDDEIVACVRIADRPIRYGAATLRMGGIGAVATYPAHQHRGYASLVLRDAEIAMRAAGYHLGMLFTGIAPFYARLGWVLFPEHSTEWRVNLDEPVDLAEADEVRRFAEGSDLLAVERIYDDHTKELIGPHVRSPEHWRDEQSRVLGIMPAFVVERRGEVVAYASLRESPDRLEIAEAGCRAGMTDAYLPLAAAIWREAKMLGATTLAAHLSPGDGLIAALRQCGRVPAEERTTPWMMLHTLDLATLLHAATPELTRRLHSARTTGGFDLGLRVDDSFARLVVKEGVVCVDTDSATHEVAIPAELFFRIFLGEQTATVSREQLALAGVVLSDREIAMLDLLFPQREPIYWWADHF